MRDHFIAFLFERIRAIKTIRSTFWYSEQPPPPLICLSFFFLSLPRFFPQTITFHDVTVVKIAMNLQPGQLFQIKKYILWQWLNFIAPQLPREKDNKLFKMRPREDNELYPLLMKRWSYAIIVCIKILIDIQTWKPDLSKSFPFAACKLYRCQKM